MIKLFVDGNDVKIQFSNSILNTKDFQLILNAVENGTILNKLYALVPNKSILNQAQKPIIGSYQNNDSKTSI